MDTLNGSYPVSGFYQSIRCGVSDDALGFSLTVGCSVSVLSDSADYLVSVRMPSDLGDGDTVRCKS